MAQVMKKKRRLVNRRRRLLDSNLVIDYKDPEGLRKFITERGKIIPRRISGASAKQQREICTAVKRARYLSLIPYSVAHRSERGFSGMVSMSYSMFDRQNRPGYKPHNATPNSRPPLTTQSASAPAATEAPSAPAASDSGSAE